jgi:hypothetical protein
VLNDHVNGFVNETVRNGADSIDTARHARRVTTADLHISDKLQRARLQPAGS